MGASRTCLFFFTIQLIYAISAQEVVKRVPQGFVGMRGKKYVDSTEMDHYYKRKPQFFVGVKGKKNSLDSLENEEGYYKRAPMGFVGMRGKKEALSPDTLYNLDHYEDTPKIGGSLIGQIDYSANDDLKTSNEVGMSILTDLLNKYLKKVERSNSDLYDIDTNMDRHLYADPSIERITNEVDKRAANIHQFFGVRGKKSIQNKRPYDLTFRGKFIGVRGKKDLKNSGAQEIKFLLGQNGPWPKRKAQMGFFGMRGKKWTDESSSTMESPN